MNSKNEVLFCTYELRRQKKNTTYKERDGLVEDHGTEILFWASVKAGTTLGRHEGVD